MGYLPVHLLIVGLCITLWLCCNAGTLPEPQGSPPYTNVVLQLDAFRSCLSAEGVDIHSILHEYDLNSTSQYAFYNYQWETRNPRKTPAAYLVPGSVPEIQAAVRCARAQYPNALPLVPKSGGHSYEKHAYGTENATVVVDLQKLDHFEVDAGATPSQFTVGAGALLAQFIWPLYSSHNLVTPLGTCPTVGVAGLALGGGHGYLTRVYGLTTDAILELQMVDADGELLTINRDSHADLFWALKGSGSGSYGIVTSFKMRAFQPPEQVVFGHATYPSELFPLVFAAWQRFLYSSYPNEIGTRLSVYGPKIVVELYEIQFEDDDEDPIARVRAIIRDQLPYTFDIEYKQYNYPDFLMYSMFASGYGVSHPSEFELLTRHSHGAAFFKAKSFFGSRDASEREIEDLFAILQTNPCPVLNIDFSASFSGQVNDPVAAANSSFLHRGSDVLYLAQIFGSWGAGTESCLAWLREFQQVATDVVGGVHSYQNYADDELGDEFLRRYYGDNLERLMQVKRDVDPTNFFKHQQSIPLNLSK